MKRSVTDKIIQFIGQNLYHSTILWENSSLGSTFAAQTISINLAQYEEVIIVTTDGLEWVFTSFEQSISTSQFMSGYQLAGDGLRTYVRDVDVSVFGVEFSSCYLRSATTKQTVANNSLKPMKIVGRRRGGGRITNIILNILLSVLRGGKNNE